MEINFKTAKNIDNELRDYICSLSYDVSFNLLEAIDHNFSSLYKEGKEVYNYEKVYLAIYSRMLKIVSQLFVADKTANKSEGYPMAEYIFRLNGLTGKDTVGQFIDLQLRTFGTFEKNKLITNDQ